MTSSECTRFFTTNSILNFSVLLDDAMKLEIEGAAWLISELEKHWVAYQIDQSQERLSTF